MSGVGFEEDAVAPAALLRLPWAGVEEDAQQPLLADHLRNITYWNHLTDTREGRLTMVIGAALFILLMIVCAAVCWMRTQGVQLCWRASRTARPAETAGAAGPAGSTAGSTAGPAPALTDDKKGLSFAARFARKRQSRVRFSQGYAQLSDEEDVEAGKRIERRPRAHTTIPRPSCDMILVWPKHLLNSREEASERLKKLELIEKRLFVKKLTDTNLSLSRGACCAASDDVDIYLLLTRPCKGADPSERFKKDRIRRLFRRLATDHGLTKQRTINSTQHPDHQQKSRSGPKRQRLYPFDEALQPLEYELEASSPIYKHSESPFKLAERDEWVNGQPELFTSMERIFLLKLVLETSESEGGCGIDLDKAQERKWFTAVPIHDGNRTKTLRLPDDPEVVEDDLEDELIDEPAPAHMGAANGPVAVVRKLSDAIQRQGRSITRRTLRSITRTVRAAIRIQRATIKEGTLIENWYRQSCYVVPFLPLDQIRDYYGTEVTLYFAFLQHLTGWILMPGIVGLVPLAGWVYYGKMDNWVSSVYAVFALVWGFFFVKGWKRFNNELAFRWNVETSEGNEKHRFQFDLLEEEEKNVKTTHGLYTKEGYFVDLEEEIRKTSHTIKEEEITKALEEIRKTSHKIKQMPKFDRKLRLWRQLRSWTIITVFLIVVILGIFFILSFRVYAMTVSQLMQIEDLAWLPAFHELIYSQRLLIGSLVGTLPNTLWTMLMNMLGKRLAKRLTDDERYRTHVHYKEALLIKKFAILTVNSYVALFYIAFLKATAASALMEEVLAWFQTLGASFGLDVGTANVTRDYCHNTDDFMATPEEILAANDGLNPYCMGELTLFLLSTLLLNGVKDLLMFAKPSVVDMFKGICGAPEKRRFYERQASLPEWEGVVDESLKLVIQFGYVLLFAPALPGAALIIYLTDMVKLRADAYTLLKLNRRRLPEKQKEIAGMDLLLRTLSYAGVVSNVALLFFTATQITSLVGENGVHLFGFLITRDNLVFVFVAAEHVVILVNLGVMSFMLDDVEEVAKRRVLEKEVEEGAWKKEMEAMVKEKATKQAKRKMNKCRTKEGGLKAPPLGPFKLVPIDHRRLKFRLKGNGWEICQDKILGKYFLPEVQEGPEPTTPAFGRLSEPTLVTLTQQEMELAGIEREAFQFAWAYPLSRYADTVENQMGGKLNTDLELDLHLTSEVVGAKEEERPELSRVLSFLALGGFVYLDKNSEVVQVTALQNAEAGLSFDQDAKLLGVSEDYAKELSLARGEQEVSLESIGRLLDRRKAFQPPTLQYLKDLGITGFCWIKPSEVFFPEELAASGPEPPSARNKRASLFSVRDRRATVAEQEDITWLDRRFYNNRWVKKAKDWWPGGAFVYRYGAGDACSFVPVHTDPKPERKIKLKLDHCAVVIQRCWKFRKRAQSKAHASISHRASAMTPRS